MVIKEAGKPARSRCRCLRGHRLREYYARQAIGLFQPGCLGKFVGELNTQWHQPRGVAAVICPWNFPLAICCGMTTAALVTGNTVIVKPAEQTPGIAKALCDILWEAAAPRSVLQFLPGDGGVVGAQLVRDPRVALIAFTGSKAVGLDILRAAGVTIDGQPHVKRVVCEMGGKNAIIVDDSADLDEAVIGVRDAAFGYSGQKCSACSRAIVLSNIHDAFLERLVESTRALVIGDPLKPATDVGPVIDADAVRKYEAISRSAAPKAVSAGDVRPRRPAHRYPRPPLRRTTSSATSSPTTGSPTKKSSAPSSPSSAPTLSTRPSPSPTPPTTNSPAASTAEPPRTSNKPNTTSASATSTSTAPTPAHSSADNPSAASASPAQAPKQAATTTS
ncbi:MAG: aldehyde dehydrogenase family protein [Phycisphaerales bacterium]